jgi:hypothetical protein
MSVIAILPVEQMTYSVLDAGKKPVQFQNEEAAKEFLKLVGVSPETIARMSFPTVK